MPKSKAPRAHTYKHTHTQHSVERDPLIVGDGIDHPSFGSIQDGGDGDAREKMETDEDGFTISKISAFLTLIKGDIGPGCLVLPCVFAKSGIVAVSIMQVVVSVIATICPWVLLDTRSILKANRVAEKTGEPCESYEDIAYHSLGSRGRSLVNVNVFSLQIGICTVFLHYIAENAYAIYPGLSVKEWVFCFAGLCFLISMGRSVKALNKVTLLATFTMFVALVSVFSVTTEWAVNNPHNVTVDQLEHHRDYWPKSVLDAVITFGNLAYTSSTGVSLIMPVENALRTKDKPKFLNLIRGALMTSCMVFLTIGVSISIVFSHTGPKPFCGPECSSITAVFLNRGWGHQMAMKVINVMLITAVVLTFPLQLHPAAYTLECWCGLSIDDKPGEKKAERGGVMQCLQPLVWRFLRVAMIGFAAFCAAMVPDLTLIISMVGCTTASLLGMLIPAMMNISTRRRFNLPLPWTHTFVFFWVGLVGVFTLTAGNYFTVQALYQALRPHHVGPSHNTSLAYPYLAAHQALDDADFGPLRSLL